MPAVMYPTDAYGNIATLAGPQTFTATKTFLAGSATSVPVIIKGASGQTNNLTEWHNTGGTVLARINANGDIVSGGRILTVGAGHFGNSDSVYGSTVALAAFSLAANQQALVIRGAASQTANLLEVQNSGGTPMVRVSGAGYADFQRGAFTAEVANGVVLIAQAAAGQTANLQEWRNSGGTAMGAFTPEGRFQIGNVTAFPSSASIGIVSTDPTLIPIRIRGAASQSANLIDLQNSAGSQLAYIGASGNIETGTHIRAGQNSIAAGTLRVQAQDNSVGFYLRSSAQSNDAFIMQDNGGTTRVNITAAGFLRVHPPGLAVTNLGSGGAMGFSGGTGTPVSGVIGFGDGSGWRLDFVRGGSASAIAYLTDGGSWYAAAYNGISARETKDDITYLGETRGFGASSNPLSEKFKQLRPVSYTQRNASPTADARPTLYSFVAEEAAETMPEIVAFAEKGPDKGKPAGINLNALTTLQTAVIQELLQRVDALEARLNEEGKV